MVDYPPAAVLGNDIQAIATKVEQGGGRGTDQPFDRPCTPYPGTC